MLRRLPRAHTTNPAALVWVRDLLSGSTNDAPRVKRFRVNSLPLIGPASGPRRELIECGLPVAGRHDPFLGDVVQRLVEQLGDGPITRERAAVLRDLAQAHVDRLDGVGGVDHLADVGGIAEERVT